jgi:hypothetical protein
MDFAQFRWWHWMLISLALGSALAFVNSGPVDSLDMRSASERNFELAVLTAPVSQAQIHWVRNLTVYPPSPAKGPRGEVAQVVPVTYQVLTPVKGGQGDEFSYQPRCYIARVPYVPLGIAPNYNDNYPQPAGEAGAALPPGIQKALVPGPNDTLKSITVAVYGQDSAQGEETLATANPAFRHDHSVKVLIANGQLGQGEALMIPPDPNGAPISVRDWLDDAAKRCPWVQYRFAWWRVPRNNQMVWIGSTFLVVGVIWPLLLHLMSRAGVVTAKLKPEDYDLSRFSSPKRKSKPVPAPVEAGMSEQSRQQLAALEGSLIASLTEAAHAAGPPKPAEPVKAAEPQKQFIVPPAETVPIIQQPEEPKDFEGEFYPVSRGHGQGHEGAKDEKGGKGEKI